MRSWRNEWLLMNFGWRGPVLGCSSRNGPRWLGAGSGSAGLWRRRARPGQALRGALHLLGRVGGPLVPVPG